MLATPEDQVTFELGRLALHDHSCVSVVVIPNCPTDSLQIELSPKVLAGQRGSLLKTGNPGSEPEGRA